MLDPNAETLPLFDVVNEVMRRTNKLDKVYGTLARYLATNAKRNRDLIEQSPTVHYLQLARDLVYLWHHERPTRQYHRVSGLAWLRYGQVVDG